MTRFSKLMELINEVVEEQNDPSRTIPYYAIYDSHPVAMAYCLRLAGFAACYAGRLIEIGTDTGFGAITMAIASGSRSIVYSCDIRGECVELARKRAERLGVNNVFFIHGDVTQLGKTISWDINFAYVDGAHEYESCLNDLNGVRDITHDGTVIAIDDFLDPNRGKPFGVSAAISTFFKENPKYYGMMSHNGMFLMTRNPIKELLNAYSRN